MSYPTKYSVIKDGWGSRPNFQHSYGLKMTPDDIDEGNVILDQLVRNAIDEWEEEQRRNGAYDDDSEDNDHHSGSPQAGPDYSPESAIYEQVSSRGYYEEPSADTQYHEDAVAENDGQYYEDSAAGTQYYEYEHAAPQYDAEEVYEGQSYHEYSANDYAESSYEGASYDRDDGADYYEGSYGDDDGGYDDASYDDGGYASAGSYGGDDDSDDSDY